MGAGAPGRRYSEGNITAKVNIFKVYPIAHRGTGTYTKPIERPFDVKGQHHITN